MVGPSGPNILFAMPPLALMFILDSLARLRRTMHGGLVAVECLPDIGLDRFALVIPSPPCSSAGERMACLRHRRHVNSSAHQP